MNNKILILSLCLGISIFFNLFIAFSANKQIEQSILVEQQNTKQALSEKEKEIESLQAQLSVSQDAPSTDTSLYLDVATSFMHTYLDYSTETMDTRRENLLKYASQNIVDILVPTVEGIVDPNFHSKIDTMELYPHIDNLTTEKSIIVDVTYNITGSEVGNATLHNLMKLGLKQSTESIKVVSYETYNIQ